MEDEWIAHQKNHGGSFFFEPSNNMAQMAGGGMGCMVNNGGLGMDFGPETDVDSVDNHPLNHDNNNGTSDSNDNVDFVLNNKLAAANTEIKSEFIKDVNNSKLIAADNSVKEGVKSSTKVELDEEEEDDDEEWAYRKGEEDKIELSPSPKVSVLDNIQVDDMDHPLNPNAAEFVPTSPVDKNSSKFATNNGLSNKVPLSTTDCKSAFTTDSSEGFSSNEIDLESARSNHENTTNGTEKETIDVNSFKVIKDSENSIEESEMSVLNKNGHDRLSPVDDFPCNMASTPFKSNSSIESFLPNLNTKNHDLEKDNDSALDGNRVDNSFGEESTLYSEISTEKSHEFSDATTPSVLKDLSAISPEKPHEFSDSTALLSGDNLSMVNHPNSSAVLDPVNAFDDSKYVTCGNPDVSSLSTNNESSTVGTPSELNFDVSGVDTLVDDSQDSKVDSKKSNHSFYGNSNVSHQISQNGLFSNETPEMNKFDVSQLDHLLYVGTGASEINKSDESQLDHLLHVGTMKKDSLLSRSIDEVVDEPESSLLSSEALKNNTKSISAEVENSSHENIETCADSTSGNTGFPIEGESLKVGITSEFGSTSASEMNTIDAIISNVSNPVETSSEVEDFEINKETNFESTNESLKPVDSLLNSESNETIEQNKTSDESTTNAKDAFDELVSTTQNFGADLFKNENIGAVPVSEVCARSDHNPFSSSIKEKSESAAFSGLENFDYTTSVISEHSEKLDEFKIDDEIHQEAPEEQKLTNDFTCYREKAPEFETSPEADKSNQDISALNNANDAACDVFSAGMSDEFNGLSKNMENLKIEDGKSPLVSNEDSNFELSETKLAMQNNQAEISQLVDDSEFGNSVDVVNKLTEEFESSMIQDSAITAESVGTAVAASAAVGAIAVAAATDKAKKSATSPAAKKAAPKVGAKTLDVKSKVSTASKPATSAQPLTKPATKSPALTSKKPIPPKASPAKTSSTVTRTNPSLIMKSKVAATVPPASSVARSKPSTSTASTKPRTTLAPTRTALSTSTSSTARPKTAPATTTSVTKSTAKPLTNGIAPRVTSTLKRPTTASSTSSKVSAAPTKTTATAPRPLPRAAVSTARTTTTKASTAASSVSSKPTTAPQRRPISGISRLPSDKKDKEITNNQILARTTNNGPRTTTLRKLDSKKTAASQSNAASKTTPETKPPPIKRMPPKAVVSLVEDVAQKEETVVTNGNVNSEDISVNES